MRHRNFMIKIGSYLSNFNNFMKNHPRVSILGGFGLLGLLTLVSTCGSYQSGNRIEKNKFVQGVKIVDYREDVGLFSSYDEMIVEFSKQRYKMYSKDGKNLDWDKSYSEPPERELLDKVVLDGEEFDTSDDYSNELRAKYDSLFLKATDLYHFCRTEIWKSKRKEYHDKMKRVGKGLDESIARVNQSLLKYPKVSPYVSEYEISDIPPIAASEESDSTEDFVQDSSEISVEKIMKKNLEMEIERIIKNHGYFKADSLLKEIK